MHRGYKMAQKHNVSIIEQPMTVATTEQGPQKRYRRLRFPSFNADVWAEKNPLLQKGELGHETDTGRIKVGDGVSYWNDLPYAYRAGYTREEIDEIIGDISNEKLDKNLGVENAGEFLFVGIDGKVITDKIKTDDTINGDGTPLNPLGVKDKVTITIVEH